MPDFNDIAQSLGNDAVRTAIEKAQPAEGFLPFKSRVVSRRAADVKPEPIRWLWPGHLALGKIAVIAGHPGLGKSQATASIAAICSTGGAWPAGTGRCAPRSVIILSAEDDAADTIRPRLEAAGADLDRIHLVDAVRGEEGRERAFSLEDDISTLRQMIDEHRDIGLVIIDPVAAYLGGTDSHKNAEVRGLLAPWQKLAEQTGVAILLVTHLNKSASGEALMRVIGSVGLIAAARGGFLAARDPQDAERRLFVPLKNNIGDDKIGFAFRIEPFGFDHGEERIETSRIVWDSETVAISADQALGGAYDEASKKRSAVDEAADWLRDMLAEGPVAAKTVQAEAEAAGLARITLRRAQERLGIERRKSSYDGGWVWDMPGRAAAEAITRAALRKASINDSEDPQS